MHVCIKNINKSKITAILCGSCLLQNLTGQFLSLSVCKAWNLNVLSISLRVKYNRRLLISVIISIPRKYYVYLPQSTHVNAHLETAFMRALDFIKGSIMTSVMYGFPYRSG